jgi:signal recognition particle subunit SRP54
MFESLANRLDRTLKNIRGLGRISEKNIKETLRDVRVSLLEADVALPVIKDFIETINEQAIGQKVMDSLTPGQELIRLIKEELTRILGEEQSELNLKATPPVVILMAGLQGSGKTTTTAKLAKWLKEDQKKSVMVTSCDIYRPAAIEQLATLAKEIDVELHPSDTSQKPQKIAKAAIHAAEKAVCDVLIIDTAGRLHVDSEMMDEIKTIHEVATPTETLLVVDSMTGQDAAHTAKAFNDALELTGIVLTKTDGDSRGGAALSMRQITGKPVKFIGAGEKVGALEPFHPERVASRILGMGDVLSLIEDAEKLNKDTKNKKLAKKLQKGKSFDLEDFRDQLKQIGKLGGIASIMKKLPGMGGMMGKMAGGEDIEGRIKQIEAIINSMTPKERRFPALLKNSRKQRISKGSGTDIPAINKMLKQFAQMQKMVKKVSQKGGMTKMLRGMGGMAGGMPPGMPGGMPGMGGGQGGMPDLSQLQGMLPPDVGGDLSKLLENKDED